MGSSQARSIPYSIYRLDLGLGSMVTYLLAISNNSKYVPAIPTPLIYTRRKSPFSLPNEPSLYQTPREGKSDHTESAGALL